MAKVIKKLVVCTGTYMKDGVEKKRFQDIGSLCENSTGQQFVLLLRTFNPAGITNQDMDSDSILCPLFDPDRPDSAGKPVKKKDYPAKDDLDDDIPF